MLVPLTEARNISTSAASGVASVTLAASPPASPGQMTPDDRGLRGAIRSGPYGRMSVGDGSDRPPLIRRSSNEIDQHSAGLADPFRSTLCWRELDSNHRFPSKPEVSPAPPPSGMLRLYALCRLISAREPCSAFLLLRLALASLPRILPEPDRDPLAVLRGDIEQQLVDVARVGARPPSVGSTSLTKPFGVRC